MTNPREGYCHNLLGRSSRLHHDNRSQEVDSLSDIAHLLPRCPRCGYGLRLVRGYWWCDACKVSILPQKTPSIREVFRAAGARLRRFFSPRPSRPTFLTYPSSLPPAQRAATVSRCPACGALTPREAQSCIHCGTTFGQPQEVIRPQAVQPARASQYEEIVYRYIVENQGEISLSKASRDLGLSVPQLQAMIRTLEDLGKITRDRSREAR